jgi:hypothetical protein
LKIFQIGSGELAGPTLISKVVTETSATSSSDSPVKISIKKIIGSIDFIN